MGEWSDYPSEMGGTLGDWNPNADTAPAGAGGDPYAADGSYPDPDTSEAASMGTMPGGTDSQLSPFSPQGGTDFTDFLGGGLRSAAYGAVTGRGIFGGGDSLP